MLEIWDILIIVVVFFVMQIFLIRLIMFGLKRLAPQLGEQLMGGAADNIPNIPLTKAFGFAVYMGAKSFFEGGGMQMILEKWFGLKPPQGGGGPGG